MHQIEDNKIKGLTYQTFPLIRNDSKSPNNRYNNLERPSIDLNNKPTKILIVNQPNSKQKQSTTETTPKYNIQPQLKLQNPKKPKGLILLSKSQQRQSNLSVDDEGESTQNNTVMGHLLSPTKQRYQIKILNQDEQRRQNVTYQKLNKVFEWEKQKEQSQPRKTIPSLNQNTLQNGSQSTLIFQNSNQQPKSHLIKPETNTLTSTLEKMIFHQQKPHRTINKSYLNSNSQFSIIDKQLSSPIKRKKKRKNQQNSVNDQEYVKKQKNSQVKQNALATNTITKSILITQFNDVSTIHSEIDDFSGRLNTKSNANSPKKNEKMEYKQNQDHSQSQKLQNNKLQISNIIKNSQAIDTQTSNRNYLKLSERPNDNLVQDELKVQIFMIQPINSSILIEEEGIMKDNDQSLIKVLRSDVSYNVQSDKRQIYYTQPVATPQSIKEQNQKTDFSNHSKSKSQTSQFGTQPTIPRNQGEIKLPLESSMIEEEEPINYTDQKLRSESQQDLTPIHKNGQVMHINTQLQRFTQIPTKQWGTQNDNSPINRNMSQSALSKTMQQHLQSRNDVVKDYKSSTNALIDRIMSKKNRGIKPYNMKINVEGGTSVASFYSKQHSPSPNKPKTYSALHQSEIPHNSSLAYTNNQTMHKRQMSYENEFYFTNKFEIGKIPIMARPYRKGE
eukprot:403337109